jgi:uncharacterized coiled-coil protein SlyX
MQSNSELEARIEKLEQLVANIDKRVSIAGDVLAAFGQKMENHATILRTHQEQLEKLSITLKDPGATKLAN